MEKLTRGDLMSLERYSEVRTDFRAEVLAHKRNRRLALGTNAALYFEDRLTMQYQVQEMLRIEKIFEADGINEELEAYNPLIPDGSNWKATFMVEFPEIEERRAMLSKLVGIEDRVYMRVGDHDPIYAIADEDLQRSDDDKTSAVHFMRFELPENQVAELKAGAALSAGIEHDSYHVSISPIDANIRQSLIGDLN
ncbi:MAG: DUF3501 family protein [Pseudomonadota bacterium]